MRACQKLAALLWHFLLTLSVDTFCYRLPQWLEWHVTLHDVCLYFVPSRDCWLFTILPSVRPPPYSALRQTASFLDEHSHWICSRCLRPGTHSTPDCRLPAHWVSGRTEDPVRQPTSGRSISSWLHCPPMDTMSPRRLVWKATAAPHRAIHDIVSAWRCELQDRSSGLTCPHWRCACVPAESLLCREFTSLIVSAETWPLQARVMLWRNQEWPQSEEDDLMCRCRIGLASHFVYVSFSLL